MAARAGTALTPARLLSGCKSALISALSLCLLLRTDWLALAALAAVVAVGSKFLIRVRDKHVFNPTNLAIVALMLATDGAWVSPGQWGSHAALGFFLACAGLLVVTALPEPTSPSRSWRPGPGCWWRARSPRTNR